MQDFKRSRSPKAPDPVDVQVGQKIKLRRRVLGISQSALATGLGVTFQQVQKYEKGTNRVGASRLMKIAQLLDVSVSHFFMCEQIGKQEENPTDTHDESDLRNFLVSSQGIALNRAFAKLPKQIKKRMLSMVKAISGEQGESGGDGRSLRVAPYPPLERLFPVASHGERSRMAPSPFTS